MSIQNRADKPYLVGEEGPEVVVPGKNGTVVPNGGTWGGNNITITLGGLNIVMHGSSGGDAATAQRIQAPPLTAAFRTPWQSWTSSYSAPPTSRSAA